MTDYSYQKMAQMSDGSIIRMIGTFIQQERLNQNRTQDEVAKHAAISRSTLSLLEKGEKVNLNTLIKVLRVLNQLHVFEVFEARPQLDPNEYFEMKQKQYRQRASKTDTFNEPSGPELEW